MKIVEEREMEQSLVALNGSTTMNCASSTTSESTLEQQSQTENNSSVVVVLPSDDMMDLLRAIEMSRLQALRENEQNIYRPNPTSQIHSSSINTNEKIDYFNELQQAIDLSLNNENERIETNPISSEIVDASEVAAAMPSLDLFGLFFAFDR